MKTALIAFANAAALGWLVVLNGGNLRLGGLAAGAVLLGSAGGLVVITLLEPRLPFELSDKH